MKKWAIAAIVYLLVVIGGYNIYAFVADDQVTDNEASHGATNESHESDANKEAEDETAAHGHGDEHEATPTPTDSDVTTSIVVENGEITIAIKDQEGNPVEELEVNHEKLLHLIIVDDHLEQYYHLHPEQAGAGVFTITKELKDGSYKAFVDIKPKNGTYHVTPLAFTVGQVEDHGHGSLQEDTNLNKTVDGVATTLNPSSLKVGEPITLEFNVETDQLEPYLGAMGHVVILDEQADEYIHVHPASDTGTIFETEFQEPGLYKVWAEFKVNGKVITYPYVLKITE